MTEIPVDFNKLTNQLLADLKFFDEKKHHFVVEMYLKRAYDLGHEIGWVSEWDKHSAQDICFNSQGLPKDAK